MVRYFNSFSRFPVGDDYLGSSQAFPQSLGSLLQQIVARPEALYEGDNLRVVAIAMGNDAGGVARGAVIGAHSGFRGTTRFNVGIGKFPLFRGEVKACLLCKCHYLII